MTAVVEDELPRGVCAPQSQERQVEITRAIILAGGLGMRLRPYTMVLPKPLIPIGDRPILEHIIRQLGAAGVRRVDLCLGRHLGTLIQTYFSQAVLPDDIEVAFHWEDAPQGIAGALRGIPDLDAPFIAMNGDILTTVDFRRLLVTHVDQQAALTIAMQRERVRVGLGVIDCDDGRITGYHEEPSLVYDDRESDGCRWTACSGGYLPDDVVRVGGGRGRGGGSGWRPRSSRPTTAPRSPPRFSAPHEAALPADFL